MKDQYFGDVNDYRKYGLLRILAERELTTGVCWMLTPGDGRGDGGSIQYLDAPSVWRRYDPQLFDYLRQCVRVESRRTVEHPRLHTLLPDTDFFAEVLTDAHDERSPYFERMLMAFRDIDLVFFDPDNGLEVASIAPGRKNSSKYLFWDEVVATFRERHSVLVYQHFPREEHGALIARLSAEMLDRTGAAGIFWFSTPSVVYFLASQPRHVAHFTRQSQSIAKTWHGQFDVGATPPYGV